MPQSENDDNACAYHPGIWMGAENAKHFGTHTGPGGVKSGLTKFWDCCSAKEIDAPGCCRRRHLTYDEDVPRQSLFSGTIEGAMRLRGGAVAARSTALASARVRALRASGVARTRADVRLLRLQQLSEMEWRKQNSGDFTARSNASAAECVPCANAAKRGVEIEHAIGLRDKSSSGDRKELATARLRETLKRTASLAPEDAAEALLGALGEAYMAGVDPEDQWMRAVAARVAVCEAPPPS